MCQENLRSHSTHGSLGAAFRLSGRRGFRVGTVTCRAKRDRNWMTPVYEHCLIDILFSSAPSRHLPRQRRAVAYYTFSRLFCSVFQALSAMLHYFNTHVRVRIVLAVIVWFACMPPSASHIYLVSDLFSAVAYTSFYSMFY